MRCRRYTELLSKAGAAFPQSVEVAFDLKSNNQRGPGVPDLTIPFIEIRERKRRKESERMSWRATEHVPPGNSACPVREQAVFK
jgi:hypothetical protein